MSLSEQLIQDSFHSYLKSSLTQAKAERLLDVDVLSSAEGDLMITGPALCLYFAALRCTTNPPSVPLPRTVKSSSSRGSAGAIDLSTENCPPAFISFLQVWANTVPSIQSLAPEHQHDLARVICNLEPVSQPVLPEVNGLAADLRAVAIEISQRRSFQDRYASDLQAALDAGGGTGAHFSGRTASFVPPPSYDSVPPSPTTRVSLEVPPPTPTKPSRSHSPNGVPPNLPPRSHRPTSLSATSTSHSLSSSSSSPSSSSFTRSRTPSPSSLLDPAYTPAIDLIRETLYASLADVLERTPSLRALLLRDPPRAYFASVAFAILDMAARNVSFHPKNGEGGGEEEGITFYGVLGAELTLAQCPRELKPFMREIAEIGRDARKMVEEDDDALVQRMQRGDFGDGEDEGRLERTRKVLEEGVGVTVPVNARNGRGDAAAASNSGRRSVEGRGVAFANRINALSLGLTRLKAFRERQDEVFKVLAGVTATR